VAGREGTGETVNSLAAAFTGAARANELRSNQRKSKPIFGAVGSAPFSVSCVMPRIARF
jgi:hypothetical protein